MKAHAIRLAAVIALAGATLTISMTADREVATAAPKEWDVGAYDACMNYTMDRWEDGAVSPDGMNTEVKYCCESTGGVPNPSDPWDCSAPPAVAASNSPAAPPAEAANPDVPAGSAPPTKSGPKPLVPRILNTPTSPVPVG